MQVTEQLTQLAQPEDIGIEQDFQKLYGDTLSEGVYYANSKNSGYGETNFSNIPAGNYQRQCARLVDRIVEIFGNEKFREISKYFEKFLMSGSARQTQDNIKKLAEQIYFQIKQEKDRGVDVEANSAQVKQLKLF
jgi:hypothetical protein